MNDKWIRVVLMFFFVLILVNLREMKILEKYVGLYEIFVFVFLGSLVG